jgi:hypothetical protein
MSQFYEFVKDFKAGHLDAQLSEKLSELVGAVERHQAGGTLTLEIKLKPRGDGEVVASAKFKMKAPERDTLEAIMFATAENELVDSNPKQPEMFPAPVRQVEARKPQPVKTA